MTDMPSGVEKRELSNLRLEIDRLVCRLNAFSVHNLACYRNAAFGRQPVSEPTARLSLRRW